MYIVYVYRILYIHMYVATSLLGRLSMLLIRTCDRRRRRRRRRRSWQYFHAF